MFDSRHRIHSWRQNLNLFFSELYRGAKRKVPIGDSNKLNTLATPKPEPADLRANQVRLESATPKLEPRDLQPNQSRLGPSLRVTGEISGNEDLLIDGTMEGIVCLGERKLMIGPAAKVKADITAGEVVVRGNLKGNIFARGRIEVRNDGSVTGDLTTPQVFIEEGALFKGSIEIEKSSTENQIALFEKESGPAEGHSSGGWNGPYLAPEGRPVGETGE